jgi:hypothetical protein
MKYVTRAVELVLFNSCIRSQLESCERLWWNFPLHSPLSPLQRHQRRFCLTLFFGLCQGFTSKAESPIDSFFLQLFLSTHFLDLSVFPPEPLLISLISSLTHPPVVLLTPTSHRPASQPPSSSTVHTPTLTS